MAIRPLNKAEVNTLLVKLSLSGFIAERDFKVDEQGRLWARPEVFNCLRRIPAFPEVEGESAIEPFFRRAPLA
ncbi:MAG: hypothetical protein F6J97_03705 [Leptolyngbya sp. SIO4C1]|nr:hypothetical protein [Leptolyngbya sp. SIO4C1]